MQLHMTSARKPLIQIIKSLLMRHFLNEKAFQIASCLNLGPASDADYGARASRWSIRATIDITTPGDEQTVHVRNTQYGFVVTPCKVRLRGLVSSPVTAKGHQKRILGASLYFNKVEVIMLREGPWLGSTEAPVGWDAIVGEIFESWPVYCCSTTRVKIHPSSLTMFIRKNQGSASRQQPVRAPTGALWHCGGAASLDRGSLSMGAALTTSPSPRLSLSS